MVVSYNIVTLFVPQVNGIKGFALILTLQHHSIIPGYVVDYMHGTLLGVTKTLLRVNVTNFQPGRAIAKNQKI